MKEKIKSCLVVLSIMGVMVFSAGCLGGFLPGAGASIAPDWLEHKQDMRMTITVTQFTKSMNPNDAYAPGKTLPSDNAFTYLNRTASARIVLESIPKPATEEPTGRTTDFVGAMSQYSQPSTIAGRVFGPGSANTNPFPTALRGQTADRGTSPSWDDVMYNDYASGDSIYFDETGRSFTDGEGLLGRVIPRITNFKNEILSEWWQITVPMRALITIYNPVDQTVLYGPMELEIPIPLNLPFNPGSTKGTTTETIVYDFTLVLYTPFGFSGNYNYNVGIQGSEINTKRTFIQWEESPLKPVHDYGWLAFLVAGVILIFAAVTFGAIFVAFAPMLLQMAGTFWVTSKGILILKVASGIAIAGVVGILIGGLGSHTRSLTSFDWAHSVKDYGATNYFIEGVFA